MKNYYIICFILLGSTLYGQNFNLAKISEINDHPPLFFDDFNNDGQNDVLALNLFPRPEFELYLGSDEDDFDKRFTKTLTIGGPEFESLKTNHYIVKGDFDGDGDLDVVFKNQSTAHLYFVRNDVSQFTLIDLGILEHTNARVHAIDYNDDGKMDLIGDLVESDMIHAIEIENETLTSPVFLLDATNYYIPVFGDIHNDNTFQIFGHNRVDDEVEIFFFSADNLVKTVHFENIDIVRFWTIADNIIDWDGDGTLDLIFEDSQTSVHCIFDFESDPNSTPLFIQTGNSEYKVEFFDIDMDGDVELILEEHPDTYLFETDGQTVTRTLINYNPNLNYQRPELLETNFETKSQLYFLTGGVNKSIIEVKLEDPFKVNYKVHSIFDNWIPTGFSNSTTTDVNMDGVDDILYQSGKFGGEIGVLYGVEGGGFSNHETIIDIHYGPKKAKFEDFDNDGDLDIFFIGLKRNELIYFKNNNGAFVESFSIDQTGITDEIYVSDYNQDAFKDIVMLGFKPNSSDYRLLGLKNMDGDNFELETFINETVPWSFLVEDYDNNGIIEYTFDTSIFQVEGNTVTNSTFPSIGLSPRRHAFDLDHDGDKELVIIQGSSLDDSYKIKICDFNGDLKTFEKIAESLDIPFEGNFKLPQNLLFYDYNNDGFDDLLSYTYDHDSYEMGPINLYEYNGSTVTYKGYLIDNIDYNDDFYPDDHIYLDTKDGVNRYLMVKGEDIFLLNSKLKEDLTICTFLDDNENGIKDANEKSVASTKIELSKGDFQQVWETNTSGCLISNIREGRYALHIDPIKCLSASFPDSIDLVYDSTYQFPLVTNNEFGLLTMDITRSNSRCGFESNYWIQVHNNTCADFSGTLEFFFNENLDDIQPSVGGILKDDHTIEYDIEDLTIGGTITFQAIVRMPDFNFLGIELSDVYELTGVNGNQILKESSFYTIGCAFDPNDKSVLPDRTLEYEEPLVIDEDLEYLIRFENVGNDSAINIKVIDVLSENLDLETFEITGASHPYYYTLDRSSRVLTVFFDDIYLPDNKTDEVGAHGFFKYTIRPKEGLSENTIIENEAGIYFDYNPPIITNITSSTYVSMLPTVTNVQTELSEKEFHIYPNPTNDILYIHSDGKQNVQSVQVISVQGELLLTFTGQLSQIDISGLHSGLYIVRVYMGDEVYNWRIVKD